MRIEIKVIDEGSNATLYRRYTLEEIEIMIKTNPRRLLEELYNMKEALKSNEGIYTVQTNNTNGFGGIV